MAAGVGVDAEREKEWQEGTPMEEREGQQEEGEGGMPKCAFLWWGGGVGSRCPGGLVDGAIGYCTMRLQGIGVNTLRKLTADWLQ